MDQLSKELDRELARIEAEYRWRASSIPDDRYSCFNASALLNSQSLERNLLALLKRHNSTDLSEKKILDVGCGNGDKLRRFLEYGAFPTNCSGIDLMAQRIEHAQRLHPAID